MSLIQISDLTFAYDGSYETIFDHVSFQLDTNWKLGFTGRNGRGKTTFLNLLLGKYEYRGSIRASVSFSYFPYDVPDKTHFAIEVVEDIYPEYQYWQLARELGLLQLNEEVLYRPYGTLSNGEQTKLQLAVLFLKENNFLLIDEPTNHLDIRGREVVSDYLNRKRGFILVSHDRAFLDGCVDHILSINRADIQVTRGNFSTWYENKQLRDAFEQAENEKLKKEISRLEETARQKAQWSDRAERSKFGVDPIKVDKPKNYRSYQGAKAAKAMSRSKAIEGRRQAAIEEKSQLLKNIERSDSLKIFQAPYPGKYLAQLKDVAIAYGDPPVCAPVSFTIRPGENIGLVGKTGSGKTTLVDLILRTYNVSDGTLLIDGQDVNELSIRSVREACAYVPQDNFLFSDTIENNIAFGVGQHSLDEVIEAARLADVDGNIQEFSQGYGTVLGERGVTVSGGQKQRISIARALMKDAPILILDDSVSAVDTKTEKTILENLRATRAGKTTILIAHRISTIEKMDKVLFIENGKLAAFGKHAELYESCAEYRKMVDLQKLEEEGGDGNA